MRKSGRSFIITFQAWCDAAFNFGLTVGPVLGAFMYDAGGFFLPFAVTGSAILLSGCLVLCTSNVSDVVKHVLMDHVDCNSKQIPKKRSEPKNKK